MSPSPLPTLLVALAAGQAATAVAAAAAAAAASAAGGDNGGGGGAVHLRPESDLTSHCFGFPAQNFNRRR